MLHKVRLMPDVLRENPDMFRLQGAEAILRGCIDTQREIGLLEMQSDFVPAVDRVRNFRHYACGVATINGKIGVLKRRMDFLQGTPLEKLTQGHKRSRSPCVIGNTSSECDSLEIIEAPHPPDEPDYPFERAHTAIPVKVVVSPTTTDTDEEAFAREYARFREAQPEDPEEVYDMCTE